ncbi:MAG TPA: VOC family protein [Pseudobdellovibrionaceae bacterium]|nr:VOC family protein [Pseudobdellovibrionaceae bacterium]
MITIDEFYKEAKIFLTRLYEESKELNIDLDRFTLDHLCWRVDNEIHYVKTKKTLSTLGVLLTETLVNGRPIATYKLDKPIVYKKQSIRVIECPAPKEGSNYPNGFEHAEALLDEDFTLFINQFPELKFETSRLNQKFNPELILKLPTTNLKFHTHSLERVIELESKITLVWDFDGTILDGRDTYRIIKSSLEILLNTNLKEDDFKSKMRSTFPELFQNYNLPKSQWTDFLKIFYQQHLKTDVLVHEKIKKLILNLNKNPKIEQYIWTARDLATTELILKNEKMDQVFRRISHFQSPIAKPDPLGVYSLTDGQDPKRILLIGDSPVDKMTADKLGATFIAATWDPTHKLNEKGVDLCQLETLIKNALLSLEHLGG